MSDKVTSIEVFAFSDCSSLTEINLPSQLQKIAGSAFLRCKGLKSVRIPASVTEIGKRAFDECESLTDIYFGGTKAAWNKFGLTKPTSSTVVHCSDGNV